MNNLGPGMLKLFLLALLFFFINNPMPILNIAEKPSVAKSISRILSSTCNTTRGLHKYCPNIYFETDFKFKNTEMVFTSVLGHLFECSFEAGGNWNESNPRDLFYERVLRNINPEHRMVAENITRLSRTASLVIIWTDCDREGENIARQIRSIVGNVAVKRARFSAISRNEIESALSNVVEINENEADAVDARIELDLRIGSAFTRIQTISHNSGKVISFGPCQIPTLNFVVQRHNQIENFVAEKFYSLQNTISDTFRWTRGDVFDKNCVVHFYNLLRGSKAVIVSKVTQPKEKFRPLPLRTVEFQKTCSSYYKIDGHRLMEIAEKLYNSGYISYPRTETDSFPKGFGFTSIISKLKNDVKFGEYATSFTFRMPRSGSNNDQAHSPIYPLKDGSDLQGDERKIFEFISRRFLGCVSENAKGFETEYTMRMTSSIDSAHYEEFKCKGLNITERNYLDVYIYDKWESKEIGEYRENQMVENNLEITEGMTSKPEYLTESDLITLMDKNGIGTDATIHEHIQKIQVRGYVRKERFKFIPERLGSNLIRAYNTIGLPISEPTLRKNLEENLKKVCESIKNKDELVREEIKEYVKIYDKLGESIATFKEIMKGSDEEGNSSRTKRDNDGNSNAGKSKKEYRTENRTNNKTSSDVNTNKKHKTDAPKCECGEEAKILETKKGENTGRMFFICGNYPKKCGFFQWKDGPSDENRNNRNNEEAVVNCLCGYEAQKKTANTESNKGREFYSCKKSYKKCKFFKWADE